MQKYSIGIPDIAFYVMLSICVAGFIATQLLIRRTHNYWTLFNLVFTWTLLFAIQFVWWFSYQVWYFENMDGVQVTRYHYLGFVLALTEIPITYWCFRALLLCRASAPLSKR